MERSFLTRNVCQDFLAVFKVLLKKLNRDLASTLITYVKDIDSLPPFFFYFFLLIRTRISKDNLSRRPLFDSDTYWRGKV